MEKYKKIPKFPFWLTEYVDFAIIKLIKYISLEFFSKDGKIDESLWRKAIGPMIWQPVA